MASSWEYLDTLSGKEFERLYRISPASTLAIHRKLLSGLTQQFVSRMLKSYIPVNTQGLKASARSTAKKEAVLALEELKRYHIVDDTEWKGQPATRLTKAFSKSYNQVLRDSKLEDKQENGRPGVLRDVNIPKTEDLDEYAQRTWDTILGYMVGDVQSLREPGEEILEVADVVKELLQLGNLVTTGGTASRGRYAAGITAEGFSFVLRNINSQIWHLLFLYVELADKNGVDKIEVLSFIFYIANLELGAACSTKDFSETRMNFVDHLASLGLIICSEDKEYFFPTRLAITLTSDDKTHTESTGRILSSALNKDSDRHAASTVSVPNSMASGFITLETNFKVYAYTNSPLQIALLSIFVKMTSRHSNMVAGKITKESIQGGVRTGITAEQIIDYLTSHAHPVMHQKSAGALPEAQKSVVPTTVIDQIRLWQLESDRIVSTTGFLVKDFLSDNEYMAVSKYADEVGVRLWQDDKKRMFFVSAIDQVAQFMKDRKQGQS